MTILFQRGLFDAEATTLVTAALRFYAIGLIALTALEVIARAFYALSDTLTPVLAGGLQILLMWGLSLWFRDVVFPALGWLPLGGLALGFSISNVIEVGVLLWLLRGKLGGLDGRSLLSGSAADGRGRGRYGRGHRRRAGLAAGFGRLGAGAHRHGGGRPALSAGVPAATG